MKKTTLSEAEETIIGIIKKIEDDDDSDTENENQHRDSDNPEIPVLVN